MEVAIARVKDIADGQAVFLRHRLDFAEDKCEMFARDGAIHAIVVR